MDERTPLALESGEDGGKGRIAVLAHQQTDGDDHLATAAIELQPTIRPVRQMVGYTEYRRCVAAVGGEGKKNKSA
jgi:hypothetical protein